MNIINDNNVEYLLTSDNSAVRQARKLLNSVQIAQREAEDIEREKSFLEIKNGDDNNHTDNKYHTCEKCFNRGIRTRYLKSEMIPIERKYRCGKTRKKKIMIMFICRSCWAKYKPRKK